MPFSTLNFVKIFLSNPSAVLKYLFHEVGLALFFVIIQYNHQLLRSNFVSTKYCLYVFSCHGVCVLCSKL